MGITSEQEEFVQMLNIIISSVSLAGSLFIVWNYMFFKELQSFAFKLIFWMAIADTGLCISGLMITDQLCYPQAIIMSFCSVAVLLWVASVAYTIHEVVINRNLNTREITKKTHILICELCSTKNDDLKHLASYFMIISDF